jgi:hypothetical protein
VERSAVSFSWFVQAVKSRAIVAASALATSDGIKRNKAYRATRISFAWEVEGGPQRVPTPDFLFNLMALMEFVRLSFVRSAR